MVLDRYPEHQEQDAALAGEASQVDAGMVEELAARALHEGEVLRMVDDAARVRVLVVDAKRDAEAPVQLSESRSRLAAGAAMPKWREAARGGRWPRGVRCRRACW